MLSRTFPALFLRFFYTNFSGKQCKILLKSVFLRPRRGPKVAVADAFCEFFGLRLKAIQFFFLIDTLFLSIDGCYGTIAARFCGGQF